MPFTHRELLGRRSLATQGALLAGLVGLFTLAGPFGTYDAIGTVGRFGYWALALGANWLVCGSATMLTLHLTAAAPARRRLLAMGVAALMAAIPGTGVVHTAEMLFRPDDSGPPALTAIYPGVAILMLAISLLVMLIVPARRQARPEPAAPVAATKDAPARPAAPFLDRLPARLGRDLVCLKMADHYVEAFTTAGSTLVLMRFADAVAELEGAEGLRVHRSHWVARRHVTGAERRNGRTILTLTGGHEAPVSRAFLPTVRAAGLA